MTEVASTRAPRERVDGLLLLNKPAGITSNRALQAAKRWLGAKKAGHTGSLDPAATGMLPLCFGEATKVCAYLLDADKTYRVVAELGTATDTADADGTPIDTQPVPERGAAAWQALMDTFVGDQQQVPPMYSALKQGGTRLYELARKGVVVERPPRPIHIAEIALLEVHGKRLVFRVRCSKGTYVRTLVEDIAKAAGTVAHTAFLHRERVGGFEPPRWSITASSSKSPSEVGKTCGRACCRLTERLSSNPLSVWALRTSERFAVGKPWKPRRQTPGWCASTATTIVYSG